MSSISSVGANMASLLQSRPTAVAAKPAAPVVAQPAAVSASNDGDADDGAGVNIHA